MCRTTVPRVRNRRLMHHSLRYARQLKRGGMEASDLDVLQLGLFSGLRPHSSIMPLNCNQIAPPNHRIGPAVRKPCSRQAPKHLIHHRFREERLYMRRTCTLQVCQYGDTARRLIALTGRPVSGGCGENPVSPVNKTKLRGGH